MTRSALSLGSNQGDRLRHLRAAVEEIALSGTIISVSSLYETDPVGGPDQPRYLNAVVIVDTALSPVELLARVQQIETARGRERQVRWGPRTLDIDIVSFGGETVDRAELQVPHPRAGERRFVLDPLVEVAPNTRLSGGETAGTARAGLPRQGVFRWEGRWVDGQPRLGSRGQALVAAQFVLFAALAVVLLTTASHPIPAWRAVLGTMLAIPAAWLVIGALVALGSHLSALPDPLPGARLVDSGVFGVVRHPIYGGLLLGSVAATVTMGAPWALPVLALLAGLLWFKSGLEERALALAYPDYSRYARRVRKRFVPFVV